MTAADVPEAERFSLRIEDGFGDADRAAVVHLEGELDVSTVRALRTALDDLLITGATPVIVDATRLTFMDSSGLGALVAAHKKARVLKAGLAVVTPGGVVRRLISVTGLDRVLQVSDTAEQALTRVRA